MRVNNQELLNLITGDTQIESLKQGIFADEQSHYLLKELYKMVQDIEHPFMLRSYHLVLQQRETLALLFFFQEFNRKLSDDRIDQLIQLFLKSGATAESIFSIFLINDLYMRADQLNEFAQKYLISETHLDLLNTLLGDYNAHHYNRAIFRLYGNTLHHQKAIDYDHFIQNMIAEKIDHQLCNHYIPLLPTFIGSLLSYCSNQEYATDELERLMMLWVKSHSKTDQIAEHTQEVIIHYWRTGDKLKQFQKTIDILMTKMKAHDRKNHSFVTTFISATNPEAPYYHKLLQLGFAIDPYETITEECNYYHPDHTLKELQNHYAIDHDAVAKYLFTYTRKSPLKEIPEGDLIQIATNFSYLKKIITTEDLEGGLTYLNKNNPTLARPMLLASLDINNKAIKEKLRKWLPTYQHISDDITPLLSSKKKLIRESATIIMDQLGV